MPEPETPEFKGYNPPEEPEPRWTIRATGPLTFMAGIARMSRHGEVEALPAKIELALNSHDDLLLAAKKLERIVDAMNGPDGHKASQHAPADCTLCFARRAIAKAGG